MVCFMLPDGLDGDMFLDRRLKFTVLHLASPASNVFTVSHHEVLDGSHPSVNGGT